MASPNARKLKKLLTTRDPAVIRQGVELAVALDDGRVVDELLEGVSYDPTAEPTGRSGAERTGRVVLPSALAPSERQRVFSELGVLGLISHGRGQRAAALRREITTLVISHGYDDKAPALIDAWLLTGLSSLTQLRIGARGLAGLGSLGKLEALALLMVGVHGPLEGDLAGLGAAPALRTLSLYLRGPVSLAGIEGARLDKLALSIAGLRDLGPLARVSVRELELGDCAPRSLKPIARIAALESLKLARVAGDPGMLRGSPVKRLSLAVIARKVELRGLEALEDLDVWARASRHDGIRPAELDLSELPSLRRLRFRGEETRLHVRLDVPALEELVLGSHEIELGTIVAPRLRSASLEGLTDSASFAAMKSVRELHLSGSLTSLAPIRRLPALRALRLDCVELTSLRAMPEIHPDDGASPALDLEGCTELTNLLGVGRYRGLTRLALGGASALKSLRGIEEIDALHTLELKGCERLASLAGLEAMRSLRALDLRECRSLRDVSALGALDDLRVIAIHGTQLAAHHFPAALEWAVTDARKPDLEKLAEREPPRDRAGRARKGPVARELLPVWDEVMKHLWSSRIDSAIETLRASAAAGPILEALLAGTKAKHGCLEAGRALTKALRPEQSGANFVATRLLGELDVHTPALDALRESVTTMYAGGRSSWAGTLDSRSIRAFPSLKRVSSSGIGVEGLRHARKLEYLSLTELSDPIADLADIGACAALRRLTITLAPGCDLTPLAGLSCLEELSVWGDGPFDVAPLASCSALSRLHVSEVGEELPPLPGSLRSLSVGGPLLRSLGALESAAELRFLGIRRAPNLVALPPLPASLRAIHGEDVGAIDLGAVASSQLRCLVLQRAQIPDLASLAGAPALQEMELEECGVVDIAALREVLQLSWLTIAQDTPAPDLSPLVGHPSLRSVATSPPPVSLPAGLEKTMSQSVHIECAFNVEQRWTR